MEDRERTHRAGSRAPQIPAEPAPPITSRFLFVDVAALRAKQLRRGARVRFRDERGSNGARTRRSGSRWKRSGAGSCAYDVPAAAESRGCAGGKAKHDATDVQQIAMGALQGLGASTVFVLALFIGFCVIVGFTKTKKTAGGTRDGRQEPRRADLASRRSSISSPARRTAPPTSSSRRNSRRNTESGIGNW